MEEDKKTINITATATKKKPKKKKKVKNPPAVVQPEYNFEKDLEDLGNIDPKSLTNLNTDDLRKRMVKGIYLLEHCLFSQAGFEFTRIHNVRDLLTELEKEIFKPETMKNLTEGERLRLYRMCMNNMTNSLEFLSNLHKNVTLGIEAVNSIDRMKADRGIGRTDEKGTDEVSAIRQLILDQIAKKVKKSS